MIQTKDQPRSKEQIREEILTLVREYHGVAFPERVFEAGSSIIPVSGKVFDATEMETWWTLGWISG